MIVIMSEIGTAFFSKKLDSLHPFKELRWSSDIVDCGIFENNEMTTLIIERIVHTIKIMENSACRLIYRPRKGPIDVANVLLKEK